MDGHPPVNKAPEQPLIITRQQISYALGCLVVAIMMVCLTYAAIQCGERLAPNWKGNYLLAVNFAICLETAIALRLVSQHEALTPEWILYRVTEWVVILITIKILIYLGTGPAQILKDTLLWEHDFFHTFFNGEYNVAIVSAAITWVVARLFAGHLMELEDDPELLSLERQGIGIKYRDKIQHNLMALIFILGSVLLVLTTLANLKSPLLSGKTASSPLQISLLVLYFILGFILLAQSQYNIVNARWYIQEIPASSAIPGRWAIFSIVLILAAGILASVLPTGYSIGLLQALQLLTGFILEALVSIAQFLLAVFNLVIGLLSQLLGFHTPSLSNITPPAQPFPPPPHEADSPDDIVRLLKSLFFWTVFFCLIFFSFKYYFNQHKELVESAKKAPLIRWIRAFILWFKSKFSRLRQQIELSIRSGAARWRGARSNKRVIPSDKLNLKKLSPRQQIVAIYLSAIQRVEAYGIKRRQSQTPFEFAAMLHERLPDIETAIDALTAGFMEARYTPHPIISEHVDRARRYYRTILAALEQQGDLS
jgi:hypothetical protein